MPATSSFVKIEASQIKIVGNKVSSRRNIESKTGAFSQS